MIPPHVLTKGTRIGLIFALTLIPLEVMMGSPAAHPVPAHDRIRGDVLMQFASNGHVVGFESRAICVASADHALRVEFVGAHDVKPRLDGGRDIQAAHAGEEPSLQEMTYDNLWDGVTLRYRMPKGILSQSTYYLSSQALVGQIRLRYNTSVRIDRRGNLVMDLSSGHFTESAPQAWQEINGLRVPVDIRFERLGDAEIGFRVGHYDRKKPLVIDPSLTWNSFLGGPADDAATGIVLDDSGNIYVTGLSWDTWGKPVAAFSGEIDTFVAKLNGSGVLQWNTFLGGQDIDEAGGIALDHQGNVLVTGTSWASWGDPLNTFGGSGSSAYVAKLDGTGRRLWNTFLGAGNIHSGNNIAADSSRNIYVAGNSSASWGKPINPYAGKKDAFIAKLSSVGAIVWNTFAGGAQDDSGNGIVVDATNNVIVVGVSDGSWGEPIRAYSDKHDGFVAKFDPAGVRLWHTFLGGPRDDYAFGLTLDSKANVYAVGYSYASWGNPLNGYVAQSDIFVAKLDDIGVLTWNTFLGGPEDDQGYGIAIDNDSNLFVAGSSGGSWGKPANAFTGGTDVLVAKLAPSGSLAWNTFLGSMSADSAYAIAIDNNASVYAAGMSEGSWGNPISSFGLGGSQVFVVKIFDEQSCKSPSIAGQPRGKFVKKGDTASLSVVVSGTPEFSYQWYRGVSGDISSPAPGITATTGSYTTPPLDYTTRYWVRIRNGCGFTDSTVAVVTVRGGFKEGLVGSWAGSGVFSRNSDTGAWVRWSSPASQVVVGDMDGDGIDDLIGNWPESGVWVKYSSTGQWARLTTAAEWLAMGDLNGDGKADLLGIWNSVLWTMDAQSDTWVSVSSGASQVVSGDLDGDGKSDIVGVWKDSGVWARYSTTGRWILLASVPDWIAVGDLNGDGKGDLLGIWNGQVWALDSATSAWSSISSGASKVVAGDFDGDGKDDIIGIWPGTGVWVRYSASSAWERLSSDADSIAAGRMR